MMNFQRSSGVFGPDVFAVQGSRPRLRHSMQRALGTVWLWIERSYQRRALAELDDRLLMDVGITRSEAAGEVAKPFWR